jgi:hypothetical protein
MATDADATVTLVLKTFRVTSARGLRDAPKPNGSGR